MGEKKEWKGERRRRNPLFDVPFVANVATLVVEDCLIM